MSENTAQIRSSTIDDQKIWIGKPCLYYDAHNIEHHALITALWGMDDSGPRSVNLVYVSSDDAQTDQYGRQIARNTSVVRFDSQAAHGNYFRLNSLDAG